MTLAGSRPAACSVARLVTPLDNTPILTPVPITPAACTMSAPCALTPEVSGPTLRIDPPCTDLSVVANAGKARPNWARMPAWRVLRTGCGNIGPLF